jgi:hypothetical protein
MEWLIIIIPLILAMAMQAETNKKRRLEKWREEANKPFNPGNIYQTHPDLKGGRPTRDALKKAGCI